MTTKVKRIILVIFTVVLTSALIVGFSGCATATTQANAEKAWYSNKDSKTVTTDASVNMRLPFYNDPNGTMIESFISITGKVSFLRSYNNNELTKAKVVFKEIKIEASGTQIDTMISTVTSLLGNLATPISPAVLNLLSSLKSGITLTNIAEITLFVKEQKLYYDYTIYLQSILSTLSLTLSDIGLTELREKLDANGNLIPNKDSSDDMFPIMNHDKEHFGLDFVKTVMGMFYAGDINLDRVSIFDFSKAKYTKEKGLTKATIDPHIALNDITSRLYSILDEMLTEDKRTVFINKIIDVAKLTMSAEKEATFDPAKITKGINDTANKMIDLMTIIAPEATPKEVINQLLTLDAKMSAMIEYTKDKKLKSLKGDLKGKLSLSRYHLDAIMAKLGEGSESAIFKFAPAIFALIYDSTATTEAAKKEAFARVTVSLSWTNSYSI